MKMATSAGGYLTEDGSPRTSLNTKAAAYHKQNNLCRLRGMSCAHDTAWLPKGEESLLRNKFASFYPQLGDSESNLPVLADISRAFLYDEDVFLLRRPWWRLDHRLPSGAPIIAGRQRRQRARLQGMSSPWSSADSQFLPTIGSLIHQRLENSLPQRLTDKWALKPRSGVDPARATMKPVPLRVEDFAPSQV